jgi:hypothetical protein
MAEGKTLQLRESDAAASRQRLEDLDINSRHNRIRTANAQAEMYGSRLRQLHQARCWARRR